MRVLMISLFLGVTLAAPQGYNYQIELSPSGNSIQAIPNQYQFIQQQFQQQPQIIYQQQLPQYQQPAQTISLDQQGAYQLLQNAQQVIQYEQQQHQEFPQQQLLENAQQVIQYEQQHQELPQQQLLESAQQVTQYEQQQHQEAEQPQQQKQELEPQLPATVVEQPSVEVTKTTEPSKPADQPQIDVDFQPQFIIQSKQPTPDVHYQEPVQNQKVTFQKEFYYLSAPQEDEDETAKDLEEQLSTLKKNLRVVFIKAPENNGIEKAALKLAQQSANAKTAIYVLTKQHSASDLAQKLQSIQTTTAQRPEVSFIKYRTPEEAEHAQRVIQAQYEALDGPNSINRPATGVTHNFVGAKAGGIEPRKPSLVAVEKPKKTRPVSKYLPSASKH